MGVGVGVGVGIGVGVGVGVGMGVVGVGDGGSQRALRGRCPAGEQPQQLAASLGLGGLLASHI